MNKAEYHQLFISKIPDIIEGHRAYNVLIDATTPIDDEEHRINTSLDRRNFNVDEIEMLSEAYKWHESELSKMGIDPLDHLPFTQADKDYIDRYVVNKPWYKRLFLKLF